MGAFGRELCNFGGCPNRARYQITSRRNFCEFVVCDEHRDEALDFPVYRADGQVWDSGSGDGPCRRPNEINQAPTVPVSWWLLDEESS